MRDVLFWRGVFALLGATVVLAFAYRRRSRWLGVVAAPLIGIGIYLVWYTNRTVPDPLTHNVRPGLGYERVIEAGPMVAHVLEVDLTANIEWLGTSPRRRDGHQTTAERTSAFLVRTGATLAINTAYFAPWHSNTILDYYPHVDDPVDCIGVAISNGQRVAPYDPALGSLWILDDGTARISNVDHPDARFAYSGFMMIDDGVLSPPSKGTAHGTKHPRTAAALDREGRKLWLFVVDGRQPGYSDGATVPELARLALDRGVWDAVLFDGGGSATMVLADGDDARILNTPVHGRHPPGLERPVACQLGIKFR